MTKSKEVIAEIIYYRIVEQWPVGTVARHLHIHEDTVNRYTKGYLSASAQTVKTDESGKRKRQRGSLISKFIPFIEETYKDTPEIKAARLYQMVVAKGYQGKQDHFRHLLVKLGLKPKKQPEVFLRLTVLAGEQAQVDWAEFGKIRIGQAEHKIYAFIMVLSHSRRIFVRFMLNMNFDSFLLGHQQAFTEWGGVPNTILSDNLKSAVINRYGKLINHNKQYLDFAAHYRFKPQPVGIRRGNEKGRVERAVRYIRESFFAGRHITDIERLNEEVIQWCNDYALMRPWADYKEITVKRAFEKEAPYLKALPTTPYEIYERKQVRVDKTAHIRYERNDYSVQPAYVGKLVIVHGSAKQVKVYADAVEIACHERSYDKGQLIQDNNHLETIRQYKHLALEHSLTSEVCAGIQSAQAFLTLASEAGQSLPGIVKGLNRLLKQYTKAQVEYGIAEALKTQSYHHVTVKKAIEKQLEADNVATSIPNSASEKLKSTEQPNANTTRQSEQAEQTKSFIPNMAQYDNL